MGILDFSVQKREIAYRNHKDSESHYQPVDSSEVSVLCVGEPYDIVRAHLGELNQNEIVNFWTFGRYAMHHVLKYVLSQTGPADVAACTWAISTRAVEDLLSLRKEGLLRSFKLWIDPRVKVRNPEPMQIIQLNWPFVIAPVHAKVCTVSNDEWKISIYGSLNFTTNPQPERGSIATIGHVFDADNEIIERQFSNDAELQKHREEVKQMDEEAAAEFIDMAEQAEALGIERREQKRAAWHEGATYTTPRCDMVERIKYHQRSDMSLMSAFESTEEGYELTAIKKDFYNIGRFADSLCKIIDKMIGTASREIYAIVTPPKRRHKTKNFAESLAMEISNRTNIKYYPDAVTTESSVRINPVFELHAEIKEPVVIILDDIITTGSTIRATGKLFPDKSVMYIVGIYNG